MTRSATRSSGGVERDAAPACADESDEPDEPGAAPGAALPNGNIGKGFSLSNQLTLRLSADVLAASYQDLKGGSYEDTLTIELRP